MRVDDMRNDAGIHTGFSVSNAFLTRREACEIVGAIAGAAIVRVESRRSRWVRYCTLGVWAEEVFCEFLLDGVPFMVMEPFGDNDCYWIVAERPASEAASYVVRARAAFLAAGTRHRVPVV